jgi:hypothetical protein
LPRFSSAGGYETFDPSGLVGRRDHEGKKVTTRDRYTQFERFVNVAHPYSWAALPKLDMMGGAWREGTTDKTSLLVPVNCQGYRNVNRCGVLDTWIEECHNRRIAQSLRSSADQHYREVAFGRVGII